MCTLNVRYFDGRKSPASSFSLSNSAFVQR